MSKVVMNAGFDPWEILVAGITEITRRLGKKRFQELLGGLIRKPAGKLILVPETDERSELNNIRDDFKEEVTS